MQKKKVVGERLNTVVVHGEVHPMVNEPDKLAVILDVVESGGSVKTACEQAKVSYSTFTQWMGKHEGLRVLVDYARSKKELQKERLDVKAVNLVEEKVEAGEDRLAQWWLENREFKQDKGGNVQVNVFSQAIEKAREFVDE